MTLATAEKDALLLLSQRLGHSFADPDLLRRALTHSSKAYEEQTLLEGPSASGKSAGDRGNEQMEFLGDAVLGMLVAAWLYRNHGHDDEGRLTRLRAAVVSRNTLAGVAVRLGLGQHLRLGRGEEQSGGRQKAALLADALEAVIAALYLDGGVDAAEQFVTREIMQPEAARQNAGLAEIEDWKSAVQEWLQARGLGRAQYVLVEAGGPDHAKVFRVALHWNGEELAESTASSKKQAEQQCARTALEILRSRGAN